MEATAMDMRIPVFCPECKSVFSSGIRLTGSNIKVDLKSNVFICECGHECTIRDGVYGVFDGIFRIHHGHYGTPENLEEICNIGREVGYGLREPDGALRDIVSLLPPESAAAIKQLGINSSLGIVMLIVVMVTMVSGAANNLIQAVRSVFPSNPAPNTIINNHNTIINFPAPADGGNCTIPDPPKKGSVGRRKQMEKIKKKAARKRDG